MLPATRVTTSLAPPSRPSCHGLSGSFLRRWGSQPQQATSRPGTRQQEKTGDRSLRASARASPRTQPPIPVEKAIALSTSIENTIERTPQMRIHTVVGRPPRRRHPRPRDRQTVKSESGTKVGRLTERPRRHVTNLTRDGCTARFRPRSARPEYGIDCLSAHEVRSLYRLGGLGWRTSDGSAATTKPTAAAAWSLKHPPLHRRHPSTRHLRPHHPQETTLPVPQDSKPQDHRHLRSAQNTSQISPFPAPPSARTSEDEDILRGTRHPAVPPAFCGAPRPRSRTSVPYIWQTILFPDAQDDRDHANRQAAHDILGAS